MKVREIMSGPVVAVRTSTTPAAAARLLSSRGFTAVPVLDEHDALVGIVTEADLIRGRVADDPRVRPGEPAPRVGPTTVAGLMTTPVESVTTGADLADVARTMLAGNLRAMPVVDGHRVVGIVTRRDLLQHTVSDDRRMERAICAGLAALGDPARWSVLVRGGVADIEDFRAGPGDLERAAALARAVPGVVEVRTHRGVADPF